MDASSIKMDQKFSAKSDRNTGTHVVVKDSAGTTIHTEMELHVLRRFFGLAASTLAARPAIQKGEKLVLTIPTIGRTVPNSQAVAHVLQWAVDNKNEASNCDMTFISRGTDNHTAKQLLQLAAVANAMTLHPSSARSWLENQAIDSIDALACKGELTCELLWLAACLFPAKHHFLRRLTRHLAEAVHSGEATYQHVATIINQAKETFPEARGNFLYNLRQLKREEPEEDWVAKSAMKISRYE